MTALAPEGSAAPRHGFVRGRRAVLLVVLAGACVWRLADSAAVSAAFVTEVGLARRIEIAALDDLERAHRTLGDAAELIEPLTACVPADGTVLFSRRERGLSRQEQAQLMLLRIQFAVLLYPAEVLAVAGPLPDATGMRDLVEHDTWVADLSPDLPLPAPVPTELVAELGCCRIWCWRKAR